MGDKRAKRLAAKKKQDNRKRQAIRREMRFDRMRQAAQTANAKMIVDMMIAEGVAGNYRDYVIVTGTRLIDHRRSFDIVFDERATPKDEARLFHKKKLHELIGAAAHKLWHPIHGRAVDVPPATKRSD